MALAMVPAGSSRPIEKIVPGPLCFDAHFGAPLPPAPGAAAPPPPPPPRYATEPLAAIESGTAETLIYSSKNLFTCRGVSGLSFRVWQCFELGS
jgi:hypothetical protein